MVINNNEITDPIDIRVKTIFEFARDYDVRGSLKALFRTGASLKVPVSLDDEDPFEHGAECATLPHEDQQLAKARASTKITVHPDGFPQSYHWYVPPGRHEYRYTIPSGIPMPFDTTVHYIAVHLHGYGESLELLDKTDGRSIYKSMARNYTDRIGIAELKHFSSVEGIPVFKDHEYELVAVYNNPTDRNIDAMAVMYMYLYDKNFDVTLAVWKEKGQAKENAKKN